MYNKAIEIETREFYNAFSVTRSNLKYALGPREMRQYLTAL